MILLEQVRQYQNTESLVETDWLKKHLNDSDHAAVLNGGWYKWIKEGRTTSNKACTYSQTQFTSHHRSGAFIDKEHVLAAIDDGSSCLINALPLQTYSGSSDIGFGRKVRIPGSVNVSYTSLHDPITGSLLPIEQLQKKFDEVETGNTKCSINYCDGGIASANNALALTLLVYENVTVYDGSLLEWDNNRSFPMELGL